MRFVLKTYFDPIGVLEMLPEESEACSKVFFLTMEAHPPWIAVFHSSFTSRIELWVDLQPGRGFARPPNLCLLVKSLKLCRMDSMIINHYG